MNEPINSTDKPSVQPQAQSGLYLVSTPIGNLRDMTLRAIDVLQGATAVLCEDSRVTGKLLNAYNIDKKMVVYNDHSDDSDRDAIMKRLEGGEALALVSDAGTPLISDPGYKLVHECLHRGIPVIPVPGANALLPALQLSALPADRFLFAGFLPHKSAARRAVFAELHHVPATLMFYESANRIAESVTDAYEMLGDRPVALARELTKMFEECRHGTLSAWSGEPGLMGTLKGECVLLIGRPVAPHIAATDIEAMLRKALESLSLKDAASFVADATHSPRKHIYDMALKIKNGES